MELPASGDLPDSTPTDSRCAITFASASARVVPLDIRGKSPDSLCILVTNSFIPASFSGVVAMRMSMPSPIGFNSESVTWTAISTRASFSRESPVISQSIQIRCGLSIAMGKPYGVGAVLLDKLIHYSFTWY